MRKLTILFCACFTVLCSSGCINNYAVQTLNNKAMGYLNDGDVSKAICRLEASRDLDESIFETQYNLGIAYIEDEKYEKALSVLKKAVQLRPDFANSYYSLALSYEEAAFEKVGFTPVKKTKMSDKDKSYVVEKITKSIDSYSDYLSFAPDADDKEQILSRMEFLSKKLKEYSKGLKD